MVKPTDIELDHSDDSNSAFMNDFSSIELMNSIESNLMNEIDKTQ